MTQDSQFYYWKKGDKSFIDQYFNCFHFECKCDYDDCIDQKISIDLINRLVKLWERKGNLEITSGFRCHKKQEEIREKGISTVVAVHSAHEMGLAADIRSPSLKQPELWKDIEELFDNIGYSSSYTHVDVRPKKADGTKRKWHY